ncbi:MAG TPA: sigma-70 family RNA polymerase sigma factor [Bacillota bacterium]|nr:sigma-70 family RNA polymerase sigma factor [Bacillota bacterium]
MLDESPGYRELDEAELVRRAASGEQPAFAELVERYRGMVYNLAYHSLRNADDAFDAAQDVFVKAYRSLSKFRGDSKFSTWIYRIAQNTVRDYIRARSRRMLPVSLSDYSGEDEDPRQLDIPDSDPSADPSESLERKMRERAVHEAILSLSETHRQIIILREIEGKSYEEIAELLGLELGTVKSRLNRARLAIKEYLVKRNIL